METRTFLLVTVVALGLAACPARADVTIGLKIDGKAQEMQIAPHKMRAAVEGTTTIFRGDRKALWLLQPKDRTYMEVTEEDAREMGERLKGVTSQVESMLASLPPAQRAQVEEAMRTAQGGASSAKRVVAPLGQSRVVNGFPCKGYRVTQDKAPDLEVWSAEASAVEILAEDLSVFKEMADFMSAMAPGLDQMRQFMKDFGHPAEGDVPGVPILVITKGPDGKEAGRMEVTQVAHGPVDAGSFEVPDGFKKVALEENIFSEP